MGRSSSRKIEVCPRSRKKAEHNEQGADGSRGHAGVRIQTNSGRLKVDDKQKNYLNHSFDRVLGLQLQGGEWSG